MSRAAKTLVVATALALAACSGGTAETTTTTAAPTTTTTTAPVVEAMDVAYRYTPDTRLKYDLSLTSDVSVSIDGDTAAMAGETLPSDADLASTVGTVVAFDVYEGPEEGTYEIVITGALTDADVSGTVDGEPFDPTADASLAEQFAMLPPIEKTVVIDEAGNILSMSGGDGTGFPGGDLFSLGSLGEDRLPLPLGPSLPEGELSVGDTWTDSRTIDGPDGPITVETTSVVVGIEPYDDVDVFVIDSTTTTDGFELDMTELIRGFFEGFAGMGSDGSTDTTLAPDMQEMLDQISFVISSEPSVAHSTTWFDPEAGHVRKIDADQSTALSMAFRGPDEQTGELVSLSIDLTLDQSAVFELTGIEPLAG